MARFEVKNRRGEVIGVAEYDDFPDDGHDWDVITRCCKRCGLTLIEYYATEPTACVPLREEIHDLIGYDS